MKFSIVTPIYNGEKHLENTIENVISTYKCYSDLEFILIDDGSIDSTKEICDYYVKEYEWISYYYKSNGGVSSARNFGITKALGEYIIFLDSDDFLNKDFILYLGNKQIHNDIIISKIEKIENGEVTIYPKSDLIELDKESVLKSTVNLSGIRGFIGNKLYRRSFLKDNQIFFDESLSFGEDLDFFVRSVLKTSDMYYSGKMQYRYDYTKVSGKYSDPQAKLLKSIGNVLENLNNNSISNSTIFEFEKYYFRVLVSLYFNCKYYNIKQIKYYEASKNFFKLSKPIMKTVLIFFHIGKNSIYFFWKRRKESINR